MKNNHNDNDLFFKLESNIKKYINNEQTFSEPEFHKIIYLLCVEFDSTQIIDRILNIIEVMIKKESHHMSEKIQENNENDNIFNIIYDYVISVVSVFESRMDRLNKLFSTYEQNIFNKNILDKISDRYKMLFFENILIKKHKINECDLNMLDILIKYNEYNTHQLSYINDILDLYSKYTDNIDISQKSLLKKQIFKSFGNLFENSIILDKVTSADKSNNECNITKYFELLFSISKYLYPKEEILDTYTLNLKKRLLGKKYNLNFELQLIKKIENIVYPYNENIIERIFILNQIINDCIVSDSIFNNILNNKNNITIQYKILRKENWGELTFLEKSTNKNNYIILYIKNNIDNKVIAYNEKFFSDKKIYYEYSKSRCLIELKINTEKYVVNLSLMELIILTILNDNPEINTPKKIYNYLNISGDYNCFTTSINNLIHVGIIKMNNLQDNIPLNSQECHKIILEINRDWSSNYSKVNIPNNIVYL